MNKIQTQQQEAIQIRAEINEMEQRKQYKKPMTLRFGFWGK